MPLVVLTGITGCGTKEIAQRLAEGLPDAEFFLLGDRMMEVAADLGLQVSRDRVLDMRADTLALLRATALEGLTADVEAGLEAAKVVIVQMHLTFRWRGFLQPGFDAAYAQRLFEKATRYGAPALLMNAVATLPENLIALAALGGRWAELSPEEVLLWRDEEAVVSRILADYAGPNVEFLQIGADEPLPVWEGLIRDPKAPRAYFSFPITAFEGSASKLEAARRFGEQLGKRIITFDPLSVRDKAWLKSHTGDDYADCPVDPASLSEEAKRYIDDQTVARDFQFIDQSDVVAVWYDTKNMSWGVASEVIHGSTTGKSVLVFHPASRSPFLTFHADVFDKAGDLFDALPLPGPA